MEKLKVITIVILSCICWYLLGSFVEVSFNVAIWDKLTRSIVAIIFFLSIMLGFGYFYF